MFYTKNTQDPTFVLELDNYFMTSITFYGGVKDIGGNKFLVDDNGTKVFMDFGMSFTEEGRFFAEFLKARISNSLIDMFELGILPKIPMMCVR